MRLTAAADTALPPVQLDAQQRNVAQLPAGHGPMLVLGGPGTGRTTTAVEYVIQRLRNGVAADQVLMLTGSRQSAARMRDQLTARMNHEGFETRAGSPARSFASYAFDLIRRMRAAGYLPQLASPPRLLSGAEQDRVIAELIEGYRLEPSLSPDWPDSLTAAIGLAGFRREIRELIDRSSEYGIEPGELRDLGVQHHREEWMAAGQLLQDYRDVLDLGRGDAFDPAGLITTASRLWEDNPEFARAEREQLSAIVVDDLQDATPAVHRLVRLLGRDHDLLLTADPDVTVQGFRGAAPHMLGEYPQTLLSHSTDTPSSTESTNERTVVLPTGHRMSSEVHQVWQRVALRAPGIGGLPSHRTAAPANTETSTVEGAEHTQVHWVNSPIQERLLLLQRILDLHHRHQVPFSEIAVIARTGSTVADIGRYLENEGVPVKRSMSDTVLNREPAVTPLLRIVEDAVARTEHGTQPDEQHIIWLILGRYGASSALYLRRLRQKLLARERDADGRRTSTELLMELVADPEQFHTQLGLNPQWRLPAYAQGAHRISRMIAAAQEAAAQPESTAETVLWAAWDAVQHDVARRWEAEALGEDPVASRRADRDLDAVVALFEAAERYVDQFPGQDARGFVDYLEQQELPMDSLTSRAAAAESVTVLTPSNAVGQEWEAVLIAAVQDGVWPNTRLRGQLLHTGQLVDVVTGRAGTTTYPDRLSEVRADELRTFCTAISRARTWLIGTAVSSDDAQPSQFLDLIRPWRDPENSRGVTRVADPLTESALIARIRRQLEAAARGTDAAAETPDTDALITAARLLADQGIAGANPTHWWGLAPLSTDRPVQGAGAVPEHEDPDRAAAIRLSPSKVQTALESPLKWFIQQAGGQAGSTLAMSLGNFIHSIAETHPDGNRTALLATLQERFSELGVDAGWEADDLYTRCQKMLGFFADYTRIMRDEGRRLVATEQRVSVDDTFVHSAAAEYHEDPIRLILNGFIDRLEATAEGRPYVADLKTGKSAPSKKELPTLPQLGVYQAMLASQQLSVVDADQHTDQFTDQFSDLHSPGGAALVQLGSKNKSVPVQEQPGLEQDHHWANDQLVDAAGLITGPDYLAVHAPGTTCRLEELCPICHQGKQVTEWNR